MNEKKTGLDLLRVPFPSHQISKLPKPTKAQTEAVKTDFKKGVRCKICGTWHHPEVVHLDYVGHAALTDRLLDADLNWSWEPPTKDELERLPQADKDGMWIKLTVCGVSRFGYGDAQGKTGGDAMKERIGDALRNAAMRFGAALDLWHKGDLHIDEDTPQESAKPAVTAPSADAVQTAYETILAAANEGGSALVDKAWDAYPAKLALDHLQGDTAKMGEIRKACAAWKLAQRTKKEAA